MSPRIAFRAAALAAAVLLLLVLGPQAFAAAGDLDPSWGGGAGFVVTPFPTGDSFADGVVVCGDRTIAVGGVDAGFPLGGDFALARYRKDGTLDASFGTGGLVTTDFSSSDDLASAAACQGDKLVVVGYTSMDDLTFSWAIARYNKDGSLDQSFGLGGKVVTSFGDGNDFADAVAVKGDKFVVAGAASSGGGGQNFALARYTKNGSLDPAFGTGGMVTTDFNGGTDAANGVVYRDDDVVAAGYVTGPNDYDFGLAEYGKNGSLDPGFGTGGKVETDFGGGDDFAHAVDVHGDRIAAIGSAQGASDQDFASALYDKRGHLDPHYDGDGKATLDLGGDDVAYGGAFGHEDSVVAGGATPNGSQFGDEFAVAQWNKKGAADPKFGGGDGFTTTTIGGESAGFGVAVAPEDKITVAGYSDTDFAVARYLDK